MLANWAKDVSAGAKHVATGLQQDRMAGMLGYVSDIIGALNKMIGTLKPAITILATMGFTFNL